MLEIKITNKERFSSITNVDLTNVKRCVSLGVVSGELVIECEEYGIDYSHSGTFRMTDFEKQYGFVIIEK